MDRTKIFLSAAMLIACGSFASSFAQAAPTSSALYVDVRENDNPNAEIVERWKLYGASKALVIGIDEYSNGWPRLSMAVRDAEEIAEALEKRGFEVTLLKNVGGADLRQELRKFYALQGADPEARLFVWFAGHGHTEDGEGYIVPADSPPPGTAEFRFSALHMGDLASMQRVAQAKHVLTIFDSCFAGTVFSQQRSAPPAAITHAATKPVRQFLTSGDADQTVSDDGIFRKLFLSAISGDGSADVNGDGYVTASELGFNISDRVTNLTKGAQTPRSGKLRDIKYDRGDFVFMLPQTKATAHLASLPVAPPKPTYAEPAPSSRVDDTTVELAFWGSVKDSERASEFEAYLGTYPEGQFSLLARARVDALKREASLSTARQGRERERLAKERARAQQEAGRTRREKEKQLERVAEQAFWDNVKTSILASDYQAYLEVYPNGNFVSLARSRAQSLANRQVARLTPAPQLAPVSSPVSPEDARKIMAYLDDNEGSIKTGIQILLLIENASSLIDPTYASCSIDLDEFRVVGQNASGIVVEVSYLHPIAQLGAGHCLMGQTQKQFLFEWENGIARPISLAG
jgi:hypothetical protein